jgi:hypothetical protein
MRRSQERTTKTYKTECRHFIKLNLIRWERACIKDFLGIRAFMRAVSCFSIIMVSCTLLLTTNFSFNISQYLGEQLVQLDTLVPQIPQYLGEDFEKVISDRWHSPVDLPSLWWLHDLAKIAQECKDNPGRSDGRFPDVSRINPWYNVRYYS